MSQQCIYSCYFTTAESLLDSAIPASTDEVNAKNKVDQQNLTPEEGGGMLQESPCFSHQAGDKSGEGDPNNEEDQGGSLPEEGEGMLQKSPYFCNQEGDESDKRGETSPPVVDYSVLDVQTKQSSKCQCSQMKEQVEDLQRKVEFILKELKKNPAPQKRFPKFADQGRPRKASI